MNKIFVGLVFLFSMVSHVWASQDAVLSHVFKVGDSVTLSNNHKNWKLDNPTGIGGFKFGETCTLRRGSQLFVHAIQGEHFLLRLPNNHRLGWGNCPNGALFLRSKSDFASLWEQDLERLKEERRKRVEKMSPK